MPGAGRGKGKNVPDLEPSKLPDADPGKREAYRWRKAFCVKDEGRTTIDSDKLAIACALRRGPRDKWMTWPQARMKGWTITDCPAKHVYAVRNRHPWRKRVIAYQRGSFGLPLPFPVWP
jgi:hypothetical protein